MLKNLFGNPEDTIICFGDYEQRKYMKYKEPIKDRGIRTLFKKNGYKTYLEPVVNVPNATVVIVINV